MPAAQAAHVAVGEPMSSVRYPLLHLQSVDCVLPLTDVEFAVHARQVLANVAAGVPEYVALPHCVHAAVPDKVLYSPGLQAAHVPPFKPVYPGLHVHAVFMILVAGDELNCRQPVHVEIAVAPTAAE